MEMGEGKAGPFYSEMDGLSLQIWMIFSDLFMYNWKCHELTFA